MAQLGEWLLPKPEIRGSNPVTGKMIYLLSIVLKTPLSRRKLKKEAGNGPFKKERTLPFSVIEKSNDVNDELFRNELMFKNASLNEPITIRFHHGKMAQL